MTGQIGRVEQTTKPPAVFRVSRRQAEAPAQIVGTACECAEQLLEAIADIIDRDDIHQAAERLRVVQNWIRREAEQAAADPIFDALPLAS